MLKIDSFTYMSSFLVSFLVTFVFCFSHIMIHAQGRNTYFLDKYAYSSFPADINMDGDIDLIIEHKVFYGNSNSAITALQNNGYGLFEIKETKSFTHIPLEVIAVKIDNNPSPDIVTTYSHYLRVYYNDGNGNYPAYTDFDLNSRVIFTGIHYGDINGDSYLDIVIISQDSFIWGVLYNDGDGGFSEPEYHDLGFWPNTVRCGDLNNDGRDDIVIGGLYTTFFYSFKDGFEEQPYSFLYHTLHIIDYDNDGDNDVVAARNTGTQLRIHIFENKGQQNFDHHVEYFTEYESDFFICSDLDNDSLPDLVFYELNDPYEDGSYIIFKNFGNYTYKPPVLIPIEDFGQTKMHVSSEDMDNNGLNDLICTRYRSTVCPNLDIIFNEGNFNFSEEPYTKFQTYSPSPGYEFISSRIIPFEPDMTTILDTIMNGELGFIRNSQGEMLQKVGDEWVNGIGDWQTTEGYLFYLNDTANFDIVGTYIYPQTPVALEEGYQFISFLPGQPMNAMQAFYEVLYSLEFVRNSEGEMLMLIGNEWVNNIGDMQPKEGYLVKMHTGDTLVYPD